MKAPEQTKTVPIPSGRLPTYHLDDLELGMGASFGNASVWVNTKNTGAIERLFCLDHGQSAIGAIITRYAVSGSPADPFGHGHESAALRYVPLIPDGPLRRFELHPAYQRCRFTIARSIRISETTFVPLGGAPSEVDAPVVYQIIELSNDDTRELPVRIMIFARLRGSLPDDVIVRYDEQINAFVAWNRGVPATARFFGLDIRPTAYETSFDFGCVYDPSHAHALRNDTAAQGDVLGGFQVDTTMKAGGSFRLVVVAAAFAATPASATPRYAVIPTAERALQDTVDHLEQVLQRSSFLSPDPVLNDGALWSKVNMRRVMGHYPQGTAFTNDPGNTSAVVVRDAAWFIYGNDYFMPQFSRELLDKLLEVQYPNGKMPEYFDALDGRVEDDGLNINDDTPLFVLAANHHFRSTGDQGWLRQAYPSIARATRYILSQRDERGLVFCHARDPRGNVWAIASWRNIIPGYSINGAVTEVNSECVAALHAAAELSLEVGLDQDATEFRASANDLREAMNQHLINPETGLYYLNIDVDGNKHTDVTGDLVFPVMFQAADEDTGFRIISRLNAPDFATPAGIRTISRNDPRYDPAAYAGLLGGVWPGLTWWYAFSAARYHPDWMAGALRSSFEHYSANPRKHNTVPGQFSEYFDGESLVNKGVRLSPWEPPRFLWAAIEGICGVTMTTRALKLHPLIPENWRWAALRNLVFHGSSITLVIVRQQGELHVYGTQKAETACTQHVYEEDVSDDVRALSDVAAIIALRNKSSLLVIIGSVSRQTITVPLDLGSLVDEHGSYQMRIYNSERDAWEDAGVRPGDAFCSLAISVEGEGFRMIEVAPAA
jgi:hypothetical protein